MSSGVERLLKERLANNLAVSTIVGSKVYPVFAPQGTDPPYIVYTRSSTEFVNSSSGYSGTAMANLFVTSWGLTYLSAKSLSDAVRSAINGWNDNGSSPKIDLAQLVNESDVVLAPEEGKETPEAFGVAFEIGISFEES